MSDVKKFTLAHGVVVSLFLHGCLALPLVVWMMHTPNGYRVRANRLNVELFGMLSNRQTAAQQSRIEKTRPGDPVAQKREIPEPKTEQTPKQTAYVKPLNALSETNIDIRDAVHLPLVSPTPDNSYGSSSEARPGGDSDQRQQFVGKGNAEADVISSYVAQLTKQVNAHLIYPSEVKKKRLEGTSWVSFVVMESGEIKPNTLTIRKSSGYAALDANALKTITTTAPFQRPPRELTVSFGIDFAVDR
jgi:protein TonB